MKSLSLVSLTIISVQTIATDGTLFTSLENHWQFRPGPPTDAGPTCLVNFWVSAIVSILVCVLETSFIFVVYVVDTFSVTIML